MLSFIIVKYFLFLLNSCFLCFIQNLVIRITDDHDPLVYYISQMNNSDFITVKEEQALLIEYENFPQQLISLLELSKKGQL